ncbi:MAG: right-handed parallel beta-helix repeat-containing protein [Phycisphaerales bacterium JB043]
MRRATAVMTCLPFVLTMSTLGGPLNPPGAPAPTPGPEPRVPIQSLPGDSSAHHVISQGGSYYLNDNFDCSCTLSFLKIDTSDPVTVDGRGFYIIDRSITATPNTHGIIIVEPSSGGEPSVHIENVHIRGWDSAIKGEAPSTRTHFRYSNITLKRGYIANTTGSAIDASQYNMDMDEVTVENSGAHGVVVGNDSSLVRCSIGSSGLDGVVAGDNTTFDRVLVHDSGGDGIRSGKYSHIVLSNIGASGDDGIELGEGSTIDQCVIEGSTDDGAVLGHDTRLLLSNIGASGDDGVECSTSEGIVISDSTIHGNTGHGVSGGKDMVIKGSKIKENFAGAMNVGADVLVRDSIITGGIFAGSYFGFHDNVVMLDLDDPNFTPVQMTNGLHHVEGNHFDIKGTSTANLPAVIVLGDRVAFAHNRTIIQDAITPPSRMPPHFITMDGRDHHFHHNSVEGLTFGTEAAQFLGERHVIEHNIITADNSTAIGFIGSVSRSIIRSNTFINMSPGAAFPISGAGNYFAPIVPTSAAGTNTKHDANIVIEP